MRRPGPRSTLFSESLRSFGLLGGVGLELGITTVAGAMLGRHFDQRWGTAPWLSLVGTLLGMGVGMWGVVATIRRVNAGE